MDKCQCGKKITLLRKILASKKIDCFTLASPVDFCSSKCFGQYQDKVLRKYAR